VVVYITEAHARDEWPAGKVWSYCDQPKTLEDRQAVALRFVDRSAFELPVVLDDIANSFDDVYAAWPFRFYVLHNGKIAFKAQPNKKTFSYELPQLREWLNAHA